MLNLVIQPPDTNLCGQACVAMLLGVTLEEATEKVGKKGLTRMWDIASVLEQHGYTIIQKRMKHITVKTILPERCLLTVFWTEKLSDLHSIERRHWRLQWEGHTYDPALGIDHDLTVFAQVEKFDVKPMLLSYLEIGEPRFLPKPNF